MEKNYRGAGLRVLNDHAVAECRVYPGSLETRLGLRTPIVGHVEGNPRMHGWHVDSDLQHSYALYLRHDEIVRPWPHLLILSKS